MVKCSNNLAGILNIITFFLSISILVGGIWLSRQAHTDCERFFERPVIALGVFLMVVSLAGIIGACCRVTWLLWVYLLVMFLLIVLLFCFTIFVFVVTNKALANLFLGEGMRSIGWGIIQVGYKTGLIVTIIGSEFGVVYRITEFVEA